MRSFLPKAANLLHLQNTSPQSATMKEVQLSVSLFILGLLHGKAHGQNQTFNGGETLQLPESYKIDWMKNLDDDQLLSNIILPGTHDTMALYGGPAAECQAWSLEDQLKAGIRYLDLRAFAFENTLYLMHGIIYEHSTFSEALETINAFLSKFPSETVLVRVKPDLIEKNRVQELVEKLVNNDPNYWVKSTIPTLREVRGKIVFVQKDSFKLGLPLLETDIKGDYEVVHIRHKKEEIEQHLSLAITKCGGSSVVLTYSSGTGIGTFEGMFLTPKRVAEKIDPWLYSFLQNLHKNLPSLCFGIIAMDFPGFDLIQTVISFNTLQTASV